MKQLAFLIIFSSPYLKNIAQNSKPLVLAKSPYFHGLWYSYLSGQTKRLKLLRLSYPSPSLGHGQ